MFIKKQFITDRREPFFLLAKKYITPDSKVLDIGSGDDLFASTLSRDDIYMLDGNPESVNILKQKYQNCTLGELPNLPYPDNFFDLVHSSHIVEHLTPEILYKSLREMDRCLKSGGHLIISAPVLWQEFYDDLSHLKPYNPKVFLKYMSMGLNLSCTRPLVSDRYKLVEFAKRYSTKPFETKKINIYSEAITFVISFFRKIIHVMGFRELEISGYTIILRKD
ncbi:class I SAM-dependent methyltransferase [Thermodesulfobacteriota bacterium]